MHWTCPVATQFTIEALKFSRGGFRSAFKAVSNSDAFRNKVLVVKKFLPETLDLIHSLNETPEIHARKSVQMHILAKSLACQLAIAVEKKATKELFGHCFRYVNAYLGQIQSTSEFITIEEFAGDRFTKYVNNSGTLSSQNSIEMQRKAECLVHFTFIKSEKKFLLVDIQGSNYSLTDPEVATLDGSFDDDKLLFCAGNLSDIAKENFFSAHKCNRFCRLLDLEEEALPSGL